MTQDNSHAKERNLMLDILAHLNRILACTPDDPQALPYIERCTLAAAAVEIRTLREQNARQARQLAAASTMAHSLAFQLQQSGAGETSLL